MGVPVNGLKVALANGQMQIGLWLGLGSTAAAEMAAGAGFDWCLIDGEHSPYDITTIRNQLQAIAGRAAHPVVRVPVGQDWVIKQMLDIGAQTLLVPMVDTAEQARAVVAATRYAPAGVRGMGAALSRASDYNGIKDYVAGADAQICVMVQAESRVSLDNLDEILAVDGVDAVFIGPADLSADMGYPGNAGAPEVVAAIEAAITRITAAGNTAGIITFNADEFARYAELGVTFLGTGGDVTVLAAALRGLAAQARAAVTPAS